MDPTEGASVGSTRRAMSVAVAVATATAVLALPTAAQARYTGADGAALTISSDTLAPPTAVSSSAKCRGSSGNNSVTVFWTPTVDSYAAGYVVTLSPPIGMASTTTVPGSGTSSASVTVPATGVVYSVSVTTTYRQWTSVAAAAGSVSC